MADDRPVVGRRAVMGDVARLSGVSIQTVSRVLNDRPRVRPETRARVLAAAGQLGYRPNVMARGLALRRRPRLVGVVRLHSGLYGPAAALLAIERAARSVGYGVRIATSDRLDEAGMGSAIRALADQSVAGIAVIASQAAAVAALRELPPETAIVAVECDLGGDVPAISVDHVAGARLAVEHLLGLGHRTVWHVSGPHDWLQSRGRVEGWRQALGDAGRPTPRLLAGDWSAASGYAAGVELVPLAIAGHATAVFTANDHLALGVLRALHEHGLRVPDDVSVVGFDDIPEAEFFSPPLTTVRQDFNEIGRRCTEALLHLLDTSLTGASTRAGSTARQRALLLPRLIERGSTAPPRLP